MTEDTVKVLNEMAKAKGKSVADIIRQAISTEKFFFDSSSTGRKVLIEEPDKSLRQVVFRD